MTIIQQDEAARPAGRTAGRAVTRQTTCQSAYRAAGRASARHHPTRLVAVLLLAATLTACGWKLRGGYNLPPAITPIAVEGGPIGAELRDSLRSANALAESAGEAAASSLEILQERRNRRVLSVDLNGKVDEYEIRYEVRWQLTAKGTGEQSRRILIAPTTYSANRSYDYSASTVLSTNEQEELLVENMLEDIAQRILFRLQSTDAGDGEAGPDAGANNGDREAGKD